MGKEQPFPPQALGALACLTEALSTADQQKKDELIETARVGINAAIQLTENLSSPSYPPQGRISCKNRHRKPPAEVADEAAHGMLKKGNYTPQEIGAVTAKLLENQA